MDGTFNQTKPLIRLVPSWQCFSYDLKSATDRWPLLFLFSVVQCIFDRSFASATVNSALGCNVFTVPFVKGKDLCALWLVNPWAITHLGHSLLYHILVWWCAEQVYPGKYFDRYALLGDDILITDPFVAGIYYETLGRLVVKVSLPKSLVSRSGCVEFAKRFLVKEMRVDLSPVSVKSLLSVHHPYGLMAVMDRFPPKRFSTLLRLGGAGYKVLSKIDHHLPPKYERLKVIFRKTKQPMEFTLGRGRPLNPYLRGILYQEVLQKMAPKDLILPPDDLFEVPGMIDIYEHTRVDGTMVDLCTLVLQGGLLLG